MSPCRQSSVILFIRTFILSFLPLHTIHIQLVYSIEFIDKAYQSSLFFTGFISVGVVCNGLRRLINPRRNNIPSKPRSSLDTWSLHREEQVVVEHGSWMPC
uniref:Uncharacterized protein n=1 Tax=Helianthus annuus TaxID=4232 RepID=A0A251UMI9_HELAN